MTQFTKTSSIRKSKRTKKAYGNTYTYDYYTVTIPRDVVQALQLTTDDELEFHVVEADDYVQCDVRFIFNDEEEE